MRSDHCVSCIDSSPNKCVAIASIDWHVVLVVFLEFGNEVVEESIVVSSQLVTVSANIVHIPAPICDAVKDCLVGFNRAKIIA